MASIKLLIQSKNNPARIYIRLIDGRAVDVKAKTNFIIDPADWSPAKERPKNLRDADQKNLDSDLQNLKSNLLNYYNKSAGEIINLQWLKDFINPVEKAAIPTELVGYIDYYLQERKSEINNSTAKKINVVKNKMIKMQKDRGRTYQLKDINLSFKNEFFRYNQGLGYNESTILHNLKEIKTICFHARKRGMLIDTQIDEIKTTQGKAVNIYLTFDDLDKIESADLKLKELQDARDWLIISCYTAQRISDFMRFTKDMIREQDGRKFIEFTQQKTGKIMTVPLHQKVLDILDQRSGEFPVRITDSIYNRYLKRVCKAAKLTDKVYGGKTNAKTNRKEFGYFYKYELVTSHIGRRSFATNFYGKIPTSLLMYATGHSTEKLFLTYIGKSNSDKAMHLAEYF